MTLTKSANYVEQVHTQSNDDHLDQIVEQNLIKWFKKKLVLYFKQIDTKEYMHYGYSIGEQLELLEKNIVCFLIKKTNVMIRGGLHDYFCNSLIDLMQDFGVDIIIVKENEVLYQFVGFGQKFLYIDKQDKSNYSIFSFEDNQLESNSNSI